MCSSFNLAMCINVCVGVRRCTRGERIDINSAQSFAHSHRAPCFSTEELLSELPLPPVQVYLWRFFWFPWIFHASEEIKYTPIRLASIFSSGGRGGVEGERETGRKTKRVEEEELWYQQMIFICVCEQWRWGISDGVAMEANVHNYVALIGCASIRESFPWKFKERRTRAKRIDLGCEQISFLNTRKVHAWNVSGTRF